MAKNQNTIATAWRSGNPGNSGALSTNGEGLFSYGHTIGVTVPGEGKIAYDCHYSTTTARHANGAKRVADKVISPCPWCYPNSLVKVIKGA